MGGKARDEARDAGDDETAKPVWERVKEILADALELPVEQRNQFLVDACAGDATLRCEVESLLPDAATRAGFLEKPASEFLGPPVPEPGTNIGRYTIRGVIGEGGMGRVYEATQERPHRTVALKVLRPGLLAGDAERRFQWEVEALGRLNHPAIAQVHDAGVEILSDGHSLSWFAMERVDGESLLSAADRLHLDRQGRLELFVRICEGVAHAHQRGVIHRDLKPDNILVSDDGMPHILDFGIARAADPLASSVTTAGEIIGTLAYMSPEQVLGEPARVDARCDVYSLGVILFRLLTGVSPLPLDGLSLPQAALALSQEEPTLAGAVDRTLRGDIETILATALAREADRRYPTVDALAADVVRLLADEPITARPATAWYQLRKFAQRHRTLVAGATFALLGLVAAVVGTSVGLVRAEQARIVAEEARRQADEDRRAAEASRKQAEIERDRARSAIAFLNNLFASARPDVDGRNIRVIDLLDSASDDLDLDDSFDPAVRAGLHLTMGETYRNLGVPDSALGHLLSSVTMFERADGETAETTLEARSALCEVYLSRGEIERAAVELTRVRQEVEQRGESPPWLELRPLELEAALAGEVGELQRYEDLCREVLAEWRRYEQDGSDLVETARNNLAVALLGNGRGEEAAELLAEGIEARSVVRGADHPDVLTQRANFAQALSDLGRFEEALQEFEAVEPIAVEAWGETHRKVMSIRNNRASVLECLGRLDDARKIFEQLVIGSLEKFGAGHRETLVARNNLAVALMQVKQFAEAERVLSDGVAQLDQEVRESDPVLLVRVEMNLAMALDGQKRFEEARPIAERVVVQLEHLAGEGFPQTIIARNNFAMLLMNLGEADAAVRVARRNLELSEVAQPGHPNNVFPFRMNLGRALTAAAQFPEAEVELLAVERIVRDDPYRIESQHARIREVLVDLYDRWGKPEEASRWRGEE